MAGNHSAISIGNTQTRIMGVAFSNDERFGPATLAAMFGNHPPVPTDRDGAAGVVAVARYLRRVGSAGLQAMLDGSEIVAPTQKLPHSL